MDPQETNLLVFEQEVENVVKFDRSVLAIIMGTDIMICSPFEANRPLGGMHNTFYKHMCKIRQASCILVDCSQANILINESHLPKPQPSLICLDESNHFTVFDCPRRLVLSKFLISDVYDIISFCGSNVEPFEIAIITPSRFLVVKVNLDDYSIVKQFNVSATSITPYLDGYLLTTSDGMQLYSDGKLTDFYPNFPPKSFLKVDDTKIIIATQLKKHNLKFHLVGGKSFGLSQCTLQLWDVTCGYIVALHNGAFLSITNIDNNNKTITVKLTKPLEGSKFLFAAPDSKKDAIVVIVFFQKNAITVKVPLALIVGAVDDALDNK
ncbi:hypothetical protein GPJ56_010703 [Histomonas meleagridis]|uniref:uncharacterized protein n=1 Tax=Histomonas meleagridis TaxID=135588 RepID=UPI00355A0CE5|nr:hypothetical protein GPJ56_010703 [Histomonas meleagridis]KAH0801035.1 hypothetical protein GO595_006070 [Histomonas meleagridis]